MVEAKGKTQRIKARAIMIATGGYAYNAELAARFDPEKAGTFGIGHPNCEARAWWPLRTQARSCRTPTT